MLELDVVAAFKKTHRRISEIMHRKIKDYNLTFRLFNILMLIKDSPNASQKDLANRMQLTQGAMSGSIKKLLELNLIEQIPLEEDNRYNKLVITKKGSKVIEDYFEDLNERYSLMFDGFSEEEFEQFNKSLLKLNENLNKINIRDSEQGVIVWKN